MCLQWPGKYIATNSGPVCLVAVLQHSFTRPKSINVLIAVRKMQGNVVEIIREAVPKAYDALTITEGGLTLEVQQQMGDGLRRGLDVANTGALILVTAGQGALGASWTCWAIRRRFRSWCVAPTSLTFLFAPICQEMHA